VWVASTWVSYVDNANIRRFWTDFYSAASFLLRSVHCSNHDSSLFSVAVAAADLYSSQSQYANGAPPVPTHPPVCLSSLSHMKEVCLPSHNLTTVLYCIPWQFAQGFRCPGSDEWCTLRGHPNDNGRTNRPLRQAYTRHGSVGCGMNVTLDDVSSAHDPAAYRMQSVKPGCIPSISVNRLVATIYSNGAH